MYTTIDNFVRETLISAGIDLQANYSRMLRIAIIAMDEIGLSVIPNQKSKTITVLDNLTAPAPEDCLQPTKAAKRINKDGKMYCLPLGRDDDMCLHDSEAIESFLNCNDKSGVGNETPIVGSEYVNYNGLNHYLPFASFYGEQYGFSADGFYGYYAFDKDNHRLNFESGGCIKAGSKVFIQYKSSNETDKLIPTPAKPCLRARALQLFFETTNPNRAEYFRQELKSAIFRYNDHYVSGFTYQDYLNAFSSQYSSHK